MEVFSVPASGFGSEKKREPCGSRFFSTKVWAYFFNSFSRFSTR